MNGQYPLNIGLEIGTGFDNFVPGPNAQAVSETRLVSAGEGEPFLYLWGSSGTGKSHLLQAACREADELDRRAAYLPLSMLADLEPAVLDGLEQMDLVCLDDIHRAAGDPLWEEALFHLFNRLRDQGVPLLVSADQGPASLPLQLPDLGSRLASGVAYRLDELDDQARAQALMEDARQRGMKLSAETAAYILKHWPRDMGSLRELMEELDRATLAAQRKPTIPFVRELMERQR
jgi:DnaA family protein